MVLKLIGAVIICSSLTALGMIKALSFEKRLDVLNELEKGMKLLAGEIKYTSATLPEAVRSVSNRTNGSIKDFFGNVAARVVDNPQTLFKDIWQDEVKGLCKEDMLVTEDVEVINELGAQLGHLDITMQLNAIEMCITRVNDRQQDALETIKTKSKLYKTIGLTSGALIVLVLL